jgi:adenylate kinase
VKRRIVLLGPPASGKGTQAEMIQARYEIPSASPGSMLREEKAVGTPLGMEADKLTSRGQLVPDTTINQLVGNWLEKRDSQFVFDGYPRSQGQADALEAMLATRQTPLDIVLSFEADLETLQSRVRNRLVCAKCRRNFSIGLHVSGEGVPCPHCGAQLVRRADDTPETLSLRMEEYAAKTEPLIAYYTRRGLLQGVDATRTPERVFASVVEILEGA